MNIRETIVDANGMRADADAPAFDLEPPRFRLLQEEAQKQSASALS